VLDGWGHDDTHETLNSFVWGPDGWLYGNQGVFTQSNVGRPGARDKDRIPLNACVWRYHPTKKIFEVFAEGMSNQWGLDFNDTGDAFVTACVIPHLWHVIQGGSYQRQAGPHANPYVYDDLKTIGDHSHYDTSVEWDAARAGAGGTDAAGGGHAHAGTLIYLGDNFPAEYRGSLFTHNILGNRINRDVLEPVGSGYVGHHAPDFMKANDGWFRGLRLEIGPDGSVFNSDWYDPRACHQQQPHDRTNGRLYKISYGTPKPAPIDLATLTSLELVQHQLSPNEWFVRRSRLILQERGPDPAVHAALVPSPSACARSGRCMSRRGSPKPWPLACSTIRNRTSAAGPCSSLARTRRRRPRSSPPSSTWRSTTRRRSSAASSPPAHNGSRWQNAGTSSRRCSSTARTPAITTCRSSTGSRPSRSCRPIRPAPSRSRGRHR
jgi:hypothetical protein